MNEGKEVVVSPKYDSAFPPYEGVARIKSGNRYGFINMSGEVIGRVKYSSATDFRRGLAEVVQGRKTYFITTDGKINKIHRSQCGNHNSCVRPRINKSVEILSEDGKLGLVFEKVYRDQSGKLQYEVDTIPPQFDSIGAISHQLMYIVRGDSISFTHQDYFFVGAEYILDNLDFRYEDIQTFSCNLCSDGFNEYLGFKENGLWGFKRLDVEPEDHIPAKYLSIESLADGFSLVEYEKGKFGYIDTRGREYFFRK